MPTDGFVHAPGALVLHDPRPLSPAVEAFLAAGPPPVYIGFGSMPDLRPGATSACVVAGARTAGLRVILGRGWAGLHAEGDDLCIVDDVSHAALFPRVAAVVHHGGAGTTQAAARAGVPQVVVPHALDQFFWGKRVEALGVGPRPLAKRKLDAGPLAEALRSCAAPAMRARAAELGRRTRADGAARAAELLERLASN